MNNSSLLRFLPFIRGVIRRFILTAVASLGIAARADSIPSAPIPVNPHFSLAPGKIVAEDLGTLPGGDYSYLNDVNEFGHAVGDATTATGGQHAVRWSAAEGIIDLGTLSAGSSSGA